MNYLVSQIVNFITEQDVISDESDVQDFYRYGIEISISSLLNIVLVVIAGILIHHIIESIVFLSLFILIRSFTGGYHADTYFRCNLLMCTTFILTALANSIFSNKFSLLIIIVLICVTELIVSILGPIENKNKPEDSYRIILAYTSYTPSETDSVGTVTNLSTTKTKYSVQSTLYYKTSAAKIGSYTPSGWKNGTLSKGQLLKATTTHNRNTSYKYSARTLVMKDNRVFKDIQSDY